VCRSEAELPLLCLSQLGGRRDGPAAMIPGRIGAAPTAVGGLEQRAHGRNRPGVPPGRGPPWHDIRCWRHGTLVDAGFGHEREDTVGDSDATIGLPGPITLVSPITLVKATIPATTYFPERLPSQYLRRWRA
jgi:hypothetical protein